MARLRAEYDQLWRERRPMVVKALAAAAAEGDRSENAEYQYRKKELREIDRRVRYLQVRMPKLQVVDQPPADRRRIYFGARIRVVDEVGQQRQLQIVGADEAQPGQGLISVDSPMARQLLGRGEDEALEVLTPQGPVSYEILSIEYPDPVPE